MLIDNLEARDKRIVLIAALIDSEFAVDCLAMDQTKGSSLAAAAEELIHLPAEMRIPFAASMLRSLEYTAKDPQKELL